MNLADAPDGMRELIDSGNADVDDSTYIHTRIIIWHLVQSNAL